MKKLLFFTAFLFLSLYSVSCKNEKPAKVTQNEQQQNEDVFVKEFIFNKEKAVKDTGKKEFAKLTGFELTKAMVTGWNLGNTLDATNAKDLTSETSWGQPLTQKIMIDKLAQSGIKTIRIPVSWHNHVMETKTYTINPQWMARVKTIVDWAIENDMYVILNAHHDNYEKPAKMPKANGYYPNDENLVESQRFLYNIWGQIATAFNEGYDEHLIFETMNEPRPAGTECEWWYSSDLTCLEASRCLNELNQTALDAIRATGGNNTKRFVMCPALQASETAATLSRFKMPQDVEQETYGNRLILSIHAYTPYSFAMESPGQTTFTDDHKNELNHMYTQLKNKYIDKGYPVVIGEYGATNKDNLNDRVAWFTYFLSTAKSYGIPCVLWDNGVWQTRTKEDGTPDYSEGYGYFNRQTQQWYFPQIKDAIISATK